MAGGATGQPKRMSVNPIPLNLNSIGEILFDTAAEGLLIVDHRGVIQLANPRSCELFGYQRGELVGLGVEALVPKRIVHKHRDYRKTYHAHPTKRSMGQGLDLLAVRKDGSQFPVEISLNHFQVDEKKLVMALVTDITQRKQATDDLQRLNQKLEERVKARTRELEDSQRLYRAIARNFPNGTINVFDRQLNYVFVEGKELFRLHVQSQKLVGTSYLDRLDPEIRDTIQQRLEEAFEGRNVSFEIPHRNQHYLISAVGMPNGDQQLDRILVVEQNISQQKKAESDIRQALHKEKELNELKSRFVSMASHEFRTPLSTILSSTSLLSRYNDPKFAERREKHQTRIRNAVHNLTNILNDFLSLEKLEKGIVEVQRSTVEWVPWCKDLVEEMQESAPEGQEVTFYHEGAPVSLVIDVHVLRNILLNLLSNALKYSPKRQAVKLRSRFEGETLLIEVQDQGIGIPKAEQEHLFERFFRARNVTNMEGTGLGLNIVKGYIDLLGGSIHFESEEAKGTTFFVSLPIHPRT